MASKFVAFTSLGRRALPNQWDIVALSLIFGIFVLVVHGSRGMVVPLPVARRHADHARLRLSALLRAAHHPAHVRRDGGLAAVHADLRDARGQEPARRNGADPAARRAAVGADPGLPVLHGRRSSSACSRAACSAPNAPPSSPSSRARPGTWPSRSTSRCAPCRRDLDEVADGFRLSAWQKFWQLETPFAVPGLIWNMMMSMSGGWFFVVASEAITVGDTTIKLPGIGSYLAVAIDQRRVGRRAGGGRHGAGRHPALRPADLPADRRLGRQVPGRTVGLAGGLLVLGAGPVAADLLAAGAPSEPAAGRLRLVHQPAHRPAATRRPARRRRRASRA